MLRVAISVVVIWIPFLFINVSSYGYLQWAINAALVGVYSCLVVIAMSYLFDRETFRSVLNRLIKVVKR